ncbi:synaptic vesicle membrane protein VAT-1 homolog [Lingula anatina]|uniref:Synaptic vesicle membrane protein VAT-1 homolog n=2 Tax=Lingula anatina TaxID=7574 RepID=A0A1S3KF02_LINAN|nr:synaptic vesicle membrane protein VAT-1 homolog [Lingula anatina]|eukprot:XP_013421215.1 synaptic vesicle membrane protein VAT-1 homolog [Lingula anatina]
MASDSDNKEQTEQKPAAPPAEQNGQDAPVKTEGNVEKNEANNTTAAEEKKENGETSTKIEDAAAETNGTEKKDGEAVKEKEEKVEEPAKPTVRHVFLHGKHKLKIRQKEYEVTPPAKHVQVRVKVVGVNFNDLMAKCGLYKPHLKLPTPLGWEATGVIEAVGEEVDDFKVGDRVICYKEFGLWTELANVPADQCFLMPEEMSFEEGAAIPVNYITAYLMLFEFGNLRSGKSVLIHMAAGGVGIATTQLAMTVPDVTIFGTASAHKHETIKENGVTHPIDYRSKDYVEEILKESPKGVDIVLDPLSGNDSAKGFGLLKPLGKIIHYGTANAVQGEGRNLLKVAKTWWQSSSISPTHLMAQNKSVCGFHLGHLFSEKELLRETMGQLMQLFKDGKIKPKIDSVWPFEQAANAMSRMHERKNVGKVLMSPEKAADEKVEVDDTIAEEQQKQEEEKKEDKKEEKKEAEEEKKDGEEKPEEKKEEAAEGEAKEDAAEAPAAEAEKPAEEAPAATEESK